MSTTQSVHGITNGHWEREETRSSWLLLLARMGVAELRTLSDLARNASREHGPSSGHAPPVLGHADQHSPVAAE